MLQHKLHYVVNSDWKNPFINNEKI